MRSTDDRSTARRRDLEQGTPGERDVVLHRLERAGGLGDAVLAGAAVTQWSL
jgi:hypothetical protein